MSGNRWATFALVGALFLCTTAAACGGRETDSVAAAPDGGKGGSSLHITGVVKHYELEGGFYAIRGDDGVTYDPTNLPPEFQKDGLAVEADAKRRPDRLGIHQVGPIVELDHIRAR